MSSSHLKSAYNKLPFGNPRKFTECQEQLHGILGINNASSDTSSPHIPFQACRPRGPAPSAVIFLDYMKVRHGRFLRQSFLLIIGNHPIIWRHVSLIRVTEHSKSQTKLRTPNSTSVRDPYKILCNVGNVCALHEYDKPRKIRIRFPDPSSCTQ
jgi:hypothetical protein